MLNIYDAIDSLYQKIAIKTGFIKGNAPHDYLIKMCKLITRYEEIVMMNYLRGDRNGLVLSKLNEIKKFACVS